MQLFPEHHLNPGCINLKSQLRISKRWWVIVPQEAADVILCTPEYVQKKLLMLAELICHELETIKQHRRIYILIFFPLCV